MASSLRPLLWWAVECVIIAVSGGVYGNDWGG